MSELPGRPDLDQLRRQARELLRAAADGQPSALARVRAVSERVSLSAAQLAVAREHGFASWPALHAEVERRLAEVPSPGEGVGRTGARWSFGGAAAIEAVEGMLYPGILVAGPRRAALDASLMPAGQFQDRLALRPPPISNSAWVAREQAKVALAQAAISAVALTDDQGTTYALRVGGISESSVHDDQERELVSLSVEVEVDPVPARERGWLELRGPDGATTRLVPSPRPDARVSRLAPVPEGPVGDLPGQLARLCAFLTERGPADGLPRGWSSTINAADHADGAQQHLDISAPLPPVDDIVVRVDSLVSEPESWKVYLCAEPGWWTYSADRDRKWNVMSVAAEDDLGGLYVSQFGGSSGDSDHEELILRFLPRLNPLARTLTLTFTRVAEQVTIELRLP